MIRKKILPLFFLVCLAMYSSAQITFQKTFGANSNSDYGSCVQQTTDGGYIFTGSGTSFGGGYLVKTDSIGDTLWTRTLGASGGNCVRQTSDGGYIIMGGAHLTRTDANGNLLWSKIYGAGGFYSVQQTTDGGYIIVGVTSSFGAGNADVYLIKTDTVGGLIWSKTFGGADDDVGYSVQQTTDGGYIIGGITTSFGPGRDLYLIKTDINGNLLWSKKPGSTSIIPYYLGVPAQQTTDGGYIIVGNSSTTDIYLFKTDANGDTLWTRAISLLPYCEVTSIHQTTDGGYIICGSYTPNMMNFPDALLVKTDANGNWLWTTTYGGTYTNEYAQMVQQTTDGGYIIACTSNTPSGIKAYLVKTDSLGNSGCFQSGAFAQTNTGALPPTNPATIVNSPTTTVTTPSIIVGSGCVVTTLCSTGFTLSPLERAGVRLSPNPSTGTFTILSSTNFVNAAIEIYNVLGDKVYADRIINEKQKEIQLKNISDGIYFVKVSEGEKSYSEKIIIEKN